MRQRLVALAVVMGFAIGVAGIAVVAAVKGGGGPEPLPVAVGAASGEQGARSADALLAPARQVRYRYVGPDPHLDGSARAYRLSGDVTEARVAELAEALGLHGDVRVERLGWKGEGAPVGLGTTSVVRDGDAELRVMSLSGGTWSYTRHRDESCVETVEPGGGMSMTCTAVATGAAEPPSGEPPPCGPPAPAPLPPPPPRPADLPSAAEAERIARNLLGRAGVDLDHATVTVHDVLSAQLAVVQVAVEGRPVMGSGWGVTIGPKGVVEQAGGWLARPAPGDVYPLVGVDAALRRLEEQGASFGGGPVPLGAPAMGRDETTPPAPTVTTGLPVSPTMTFSTTGCAEPGPAGEDAASPAAPSCPENARCIAPEAIRPKVACPPEADCVVPPVSEPVPPLPEPEVVELTGVRLGYLFLASFEDPAVAFLVPAYLFEVGGEAQSLLPVIAVEDDFLKRIAPPAVREKGVAPAPIAPQLDRVTPPKPAAPAS